MVIQILSNLCEEGYLEKKENALMFPFFSGANVALRRGVFQQIGYYDLNCSSGEDQDVCIRASKTEWELYYQPKAVVGHKNRNTFIGMIKQWFGYGFYHPYIFKKHSPKSLALYIKKKRVEKGTLFDCILFKDGFPVQILVFVSLFLLMNILLIVSILTAIFGFYIPAIIFGSLTLGLGIYYFRSDVDIRHLWRSLKFVILRYSVNMILFMAGILGGLRLKILYISGTLDYRLTIDKTEYNKQ